MDARPRESAWLADTHARALERLPDQVRRYLELRADDADDDPWSRYRLRPRVLRDVTSVDTATRVLGTPVRTPILVAPTGYQRLVHRDGESAVADAAARSGSLYIASTRSNTRFEDVARYGSWWLQLYVFRDRSLTERLLDRAVECGARALVLTADAPYLTNQTAFTSLKGGMAAHVLNVGLDPDEIRALPAGATAQSPDLSFDDIAWLRERTGLPVLIKGVLRGDDADRCLDAGAAGVVVSSHGGRQLARVVPPAACLPEIAAAVAGHGEVYVDGDIRDGTAVLCALALGATGVLVGRPVLWGLATDGADGVVSVLDGLSAELAHTMALCGARSVPEIDGTLVSDR